MSVLTEELHQVSQELEGSRTALNSLDSEITRREKILKNSGVTLRNPKSSNAAAPRDTCFYTTNLLLLLMAVAILIYILTGMVEDKPTMLVV